MNGNTTDDNRKMHPRKAASGQTATELVPEVEIGQHTHSAHSQLKQGQIADLERARWLASTNTEARYRRLLRSAPAVVCELDADGTILFVNDAVFATTGYQSDDLRGRNWWQVFFPGELGRQVDVLYRDLRSGDVSEYEMTLRAKDGSLKTLTWGFSRYEIESAGDRLSGFGLDITAHKRMDEELQQNVARLSGVLEGTIEAIAMTVELRDPYTAGHQRRVATLAGAIGGQMHLSADQLRAIRLAGTIHDIGKISVPAEILTKRGPMTAEETELLRAHPEVGYAILKMIDFPWPIAQIVHQHHERVGGSGYPLGLIGSSILIEARILAVADVVESMVGPRPYRPALGLEQAVDEIKRERAILYDPDVVDACLLVLDQREFDWE